MKLAIKTLAAKHERIADPSATYFDLLPINTAFMMAAPTI